MKMLEVLLILLSLLTSPDPPILEKEWDRWRVVGCEVAFPSGFISLHSPCFSSPLCGLGGWLVVEKGRRVRAERRNTEDQKENCIHKVKMAS